MKRIAAIVTAALVLVACGKLDITPIDGAYTCDISTEVITITNGHCVSYNTGGGLILSDWQTQGRYPKYTYRYTYNGSNLEIKVKFSDAATFSASINGEVLIADSPNGAWAFQIEGGWREFTLNSANSQQSENE